LSPGVPPAEAGARTWDVLVLGDVNPDILVIDPDPHPVFGQVERIVQAIRMTVGGSSAITACALARLGLRVLQAGVVGDDALGRAMLDALRERGVDTSACVVDAALPTGVTVILGHAADRAILTATGTIDRLRAEDVPAALLRAVRHVHAGSTGIQPRLRAGLPVLFEEARASGASTSFDANWDPDERWEGIDRLLATVDIYFPNAEEARRIGGDDDPLAAARGIVRRADAAGRDPELPPLTVALKLGAEGGLVVRGEAALRVPVPDTRVIDTTGAGDAFDAGFIAGTLGARPLAEVLALAVACGSLSTRAIGGVDGQATLAEAEALL
jgi:sugar/nucleoside kinase (ribokinase family)